MLVRNIAECSSQLLLLYWSRENHLHDANMGQRALLCGAGVAHHASAGSAVVSVAHALQLICVTQRRVPSKIRLADHARIRLGEECVTGVDQLSFEMRHTACCREIMAGLIQTSDSVYPVQRDLSFCSFQATDSIALHTSWLATVDD